MTMNYRTRDDWMDAAESGIFVRALRNGQWASADIGELDRLSIFAWLRDRGGRNLWAENVILVMFGHKPVVDEEEEKALLKQVEDAGGRAVCDAG